MGRFVADVTLLKLNKKFCKDQHLPRTRSQVRAVAIRVPLIVLIACTCVLFNRTGAIN